MATERLIPIEDADLYKGDRYLVIAHEEKPGFWILLESESKPMPKPRPRVPLTLVKEHEVIWF